MIEKITITMSKTDLLDKLARVMRDRVYPEFCLAQPPLWASDAAQTILTLFEDLCTARQEPAIDRDKFREAYWQEHSTPLIRQIHPEYRTGSDKRADSLLDRLALLPVPPSKGA